MGSPIKRPSVKRKTSPLQEKRFFSCRCRRMHWPHGGGIFTFAEILLPLVSASCPWSCRKVSGEALEREWAPVRLVGAQGLPAVRMYLLPGHPHWPSLHQSPMRIKTMAYVASVPSAFSGPDNLRFRAVSNRCANLMVVSQPLKGSRHGQ